MSDATCLTCRFFRQHKAVDPHLGEVNLVTGDCRRRSPMGRSAQGKSVAAFWPHVDKGSWCGDWRARETEG